MRTERFTLTGDAGELARGLRALVPASDTLAPAVAEIIAAVRADGDKALREYTRRFDTPEPGNPLVACEEVERAQDSLDPALRAGLELAIDNVRRVAEAEQVHERKVAFGKHQVRLRSAPVARAAVYVPGGRAPYPSTVVMGAVTARVAGVPEVVVCSPPPVDDVVLAACGLTGVACVYRMGGAQAVAALAYGTESVTPVDVIVGPGNLYVQEAKRHVSGEVGIDGFAGPSDLLVIADGEADPRLVTLDLLAQAEHGPGTLVIAVSPSDALLEVVQQALADGPETGASACLVKVAEAARTRWRWPRHLPLSTSSSWERMRRRSRPWSPEPAACSWGLRPARHSAITSRARTTSCPQQARPGLHPDYPPRTFAVDSRRSGSTTPMGLPRPRPRWRGPRALSSTHARWKRASETID